VGSATTFLARLAGIERIEAQLAAQERATREHREFEGEALRNLEARTERIEEKTTATNGKVKQHAIDIAVIQEAERQAAIIQAAKIKAEEEARAKRLSWRQGLTVAATGALVGTGGLAVLYVTHVIPH
jgi:hypothetical protein